MSNLEALNTVKYGKIYSNHINNNTNQETDPFDIDVKEFRFTGNQKPGTNTEVGCNSYGCPTGGECTVGTCGNCSDGCASGAWC